MHYWRLSVNATWQLANGICPPMHCCLNSIVDSVRVDDWSAELAIIAIRKGKDFVLLRHV